MVHQGMVIGAGGQHRQQGMMFPHHLFTPGHMQLPFGARHDLSTPQAPTQKYPQQPQQPSTQLPSKAQNTTKRATKALLIVNPDTNKPLHLVGVSSGSKSKSPEPASVTSPTQDAKREEFMAKISGKSNPSEESSQTEPSEQAARLAEPQPTPTTQQGEAAQQLSESTAAEEDSAPDRALHQDTQPQPGEQSKPAEQLPPAVQPDPAAPPQPIEQSKELIPVPQPDEKPTPVGPPQPAEERVLEVQPQPVGKPDAQTQPVGKPDAQTQPVENLQPASAALPTLKQPGDAPKPAPQEASTEPLHQGPKGADETLAISEVMQKPETDPTLDLEPEQLAESAVEKDVEVKQVGVGGGRADVVKVVLLWQ